MPRLQTAAAAMKVTVVTLTTAALAEAAAVTTVTPVSVAWQWTRSIIVMHIPSSVEGSCHSAIHL